MNYNQIDTTIITNCIEWCEGQHFLQDYEFMTAIYLGFILLSIKWIIYMFKQKIINTDPEGDKQYNEYVMDSIIKWIDITGYFFAAVGIFFFLKMRFSW